MPAAPPSITRLAPSPTGSLHLGNARTFLVNAALAHQLGWRTVLRVEDLDTPRVKPGAIRETVGLLDWLGIAWHDPPRSEDDRPPLQSHRVDRYAHAMGTLAAAGLVYPCALSRAEIEAASSAPHAGDHDARHPPSLRPAPPYPREFAPRDETNWRFVAPDETVAFDDGFAGPCTSNPSREVGDFVVWTKRNLPSYQLAVVVDDLGAGVNRIVRGDDLIPSTARQTLLWRAVVEGGWAMPGGAPRYWHVPLVVGPDGKRLAKRHGDSRLSMYRDAGVSADRVIGLCAAWCGMTGRDEREPMSIDVFLDRFDPDTMPAGPAVHTEEDERWLRHDG